MTEKEIEEKAEEYLKNTPPCNYSITKKAYKDGYEQGQKDFDTDVTKLLNSYGVKFIDTNSIGGLIGLHQIILDLEKENEELRKAIAEKNSEVEEENKLLKSKIKNVYEVRQKAQSEIILDLEKENEELKQQLEKMKKIMQINDYCENVYHYLTCELDLYKADNFDCEVCRYNECTKRLKSCELE